MAKAEVPGHVLVKGLKDLKWRQKIQKCQAESVLTSFWVRKHPEAGQNTQHLSKKLQK